MSERTPIPENRPAFDAGVFQIQYLSSSPEGFTIQTRERLLRHAPGTPLPYAKQIAQERDKEPFKYRGSTVYPKKGETVEDTKARLLTRTRSDGSPELKPEDIVVEGDHLRLIPGFHPMVGPRNIIQNGNAISMDIMPVTFPTYKAFSDPQESRETLDMANPGATASVLMTTETNGSHRIILQHRSSNNYFYGDVPGASIAGYLDGYLAKDERGTIKPVNTESIRENNRIEMEGELGLDAEDIKEIRITGIAIDRMKPHTEFLLFGVSSLSTEQIATKVEKRAHEKRPNDAFDFEGNFVTIDGTPEAIAVLLTQVRCPLPPTHAAAFVAAGYSLMLERDGLDLANAWKDKMQSEVAENYRQINARVVSYWANHPEEVQQHPTNKPPHNIFGYDPAYSPSEQGLPSFEDELVRVGLTKKEEQESKDNNATS